MSSVATLIFTCVEVVIGFALIGMAWAARIHALRKSRLAAGLTLLLGASSIMLAFVLRVYVPHPHASPLIMCDSRARALAGELTQQSIKRGERFVAVPIATAQCPLADSPLSYGINYRVLGHAMSEVENLDSLMVVVESQKPLVRTELDIVPRHSGVAVAGVVGGGAILLPRRSVDWWNGRPVNTDLIPTLREGSRARRRDLATESTVAWLVASALVTGTGLSLRFRAGRTAQPIGTWLLGLAAVSLFVLLTFVPY